MEQRFTVRGRLDGLNEYTGACRTKMYAGAAMKKKNQDQVLQAIREAGLVPMTTPVSVRFLWFEKLNRNHRHRDKDNIAFAKKFILDALVEAHVIEDDDWDSVYSFYDFFADSETDYVEVVIEETEDSDE